MWLKRSISMNWVTLTLPGTAMLGAFFFVGKQLFGQGQIFFAGGAARTGPGDRVGGGGAVFEGDQGFGGRADNLEGLAVFGGFEVEEVHVGRGVGLA